MVKVKLKLTGRGKTPAWYKTAIQASENPHAFSRLKETYLPGEALKCQLCHEELDKWGKTNEKNDASPRHVDDKYWLNMFYEHGTMLSPRHLLCRCCAETPVEELKIDDLPGVDMDGSDYKITKEKLQHAFHIFWHNTRRT